MPDPTVVFKVERAAPTLVVIPQGPALKFPYPEVHRESNDVFRLLDEPALKNVLIDLSAVDYVDSVIIGSIIRLLQKAKLKRGKACFCRASQQMYEILKSIKIGSLWPLFDTREEALAAMNGGEMQ
ncbi:MAG: STAS domain-containing protein [Planctomycetes bacterium]|nr:STAS domain-containing protein [Planctomycetota bacterium]